jgi:thermostable 8-oxoguanine DNA glycosylase
MTFENKKSMLASVTKKIYKKNKANIDQMKLCHKSLERPDFIWHYLLQSFATMGSVRGLQGLIINQTNYNRIRYEELDKLTPKHRKRVVEETCREAKVRMPAKKSEFILGCFQWIKNQGGCEAVKMALNSQIGRDGKIKYLMQLPGIGPKYSRNIMMDVYHVDFRNSIAIDARIQKISELLGIEFSNYSEYEDFYFDVAKQVGINGWEFDRLMFNYPKEFIDKIGSLNDRAEIKVYKFTKPKNFCKNN